MGIPHKFCRKSGWAKFFSEARLLILGSPFISIQAYNNAGNSSTVDFYGGGNLVTSSNSILLHQWNYIRARKTSSQKSLYINGTETTGSTVSPVTLGSSPIVGIGAQTYDPVDDGRQSHGYLCNIRYVVGSVGTESGIPTAPLTSTGTDTELLLDFTNAGIIDHSMKYNLETEGNAQINTSVKKFGTGSIYFDGAGDTLNNNIIENELAYFGTGDFTLEAFVYGIGITTMGTDTIGGTILYVGGSGSNNALWLTVGRNRTVQGWILYDGSSWTTTLNSGSTTLSDNTWYHIAFERYNGTAKVFIDGTSAVSASNSSDLDDTYGGIITVGSRDATDRYWKGYIDEVRITKAGRYQGSKLYSPNRSLC